MISANFRLAITAGIFTVAMSLLVIPYLMTVQTPYTYRMTGERRKGEVTRTRRRTGIGRLLNGSLSGARLTVRTVTMIHCRAPPRAIHVAVAMAK